MGKGEISWQGRTDEGIKRQVYAEKSSRHWEFFVREKRFDQWAPMANPPFEDWLELLDGVRRRIARRLMRPEEEVKLRKIITEQFPSRGLPP